MDNISDGVANVLLFDETISALCFLGKGLLALRLAVESQSKVGKLGFFGTWSQGSYKTLLNDHPEYERVFCVILIDVKCETTFPSLHIFEKFLTKKAFNMLSAF